MLRFDNVVLNKYYYYYYVMIMLFGIMTKDRSEPELLCLQAGLARRSPERCDYVCL